MISLPVYVIDTHSLIWYFNGTPQLSERARAAFEQVARRQARLIVPVIVVAEVIYTIKSGRIQVDLDELLKHIRGNRAITIVPLSLDIVLAIRNIVEISEMHDRLIVCEAKLRNAKLITRDQEIQNAGIVETIW